MSVSEPEFESRQRTLGGRRWPCFIFLFVIAIIGAANALVYIVRLTESAALTPWEPAIAMEATRFAHGHPLYETGHATHMYGPLLTVATAGIFRITGLDLIWPRIVFSASGIALAAFLAWLVCREERRGWWIAAFILFWAIDLRTSFIFVSAQPDCAAALLGIVALWLWIARESSVSFRLFAIVLFLVAFLFKQTSAAFALILPAKVLLWDRPVRASKLVLACVPGIAVGLLIGLIYFAWPAAFDAIIAVPASIRIHYGRITSGTILLLTSFPIFYLALATLLIQRKSIAPIERWICSAIVVLLPAAIWTLAKSGGSYNSFLYAYLAMVALALSQFPVMIEWIESAPLGRALVATIMAATALFCSYFFQFDQSLKLLSVRHGDDKIDEAIAVARTIGPGVVSPEDPSIAYRAIGYSGRSIFLELDTHSVNGEWPTKLPTEMDRELATAKAVIEVRGYLPLPLFRQWLIENGFQKVNVPPLADSAYTLWLKKRTDS